MRLFLLILLGLLFLAGLGFLAIKTYGWLSKTLQDLSGPTLTGEQPMVQLDRPPVAIPTPDSGTVLATGPLTEDTAQQVVQTWLSAKAEALGSQHAVDKLELILAGPALLQWQQQAEDAKQGNWYSEYKHNLKRISSVQTSESNPDEARVEAEVSEAAQFYKNGQLDQRSSYNSDSLQIRYNLVRKEGEWRIQDMELLR
jgi:hypothetical protein